jgi:hypothetical protein
MKSLDRDTIGYWPILVNMELDRQPVGRVGEIQAKHLDIFPDLLQSIAGDFPGRLGLDDSQREVASNLDSTAFFSKIKSRQQPQALCPIEIYSTEDEFLED